MPIPTVTIHMMSLDEGAMLDELETNVGKVASAKRDLLNRKLAFLVGAGAKVHPGDLLDQYIELIYKENVEAIGEAEVDRMITRLISTNQDFMRTMYWLANTKVSGLDLIIFNLAHITGFIGGTFVESEETKLQRAGLGECDTCDSRSLCNELFGVGD